MAEELGLGVDLGFNFRFAVCFFTSTIANKIGVKNTFIIGTTGTELALQGPRSADLVRSTGYVIYSAALYQNNRHGTEWVGCTTYQCATFRANAVLPTVRALRLGVLWPVGRSLLGRGGSDCGQL